MKFIKKAALNKRRAIAIVIGILLLAFWLTWCGPLYWFYCYLINDFDIKPYFGNFTTEELLSADFDRAEITWDLGTPTTTLTQQQAEELVGILTGAEFRSILWNPSGDNLYWGKWGEQINIIFISDKPIFIADSCRQGHTQFWIYDDKLIAVIRVLSRKRAGDGENTAWRLTTSFAYVNESPELVHAVNTFMSTIDRPPVDETPVEAPPKSVLVKDSSVAPSGSDSNVVSYVDSGS